MRFRLSPALPLALGIFAFTLALYTRTLAPGTLMGLGDPGDLQAAVAGLGVPHPTGYPLFVLLGWAWVHLWPLGSMAYRLNLLVAILGALAVALTYLLALRLSGRHLPALAGALFLGLSYTFWTQTSISEVYTLNAVFVAAVLYLLVRWREAHTDPAQGAAATLLLAAFVYGLSLAHHRTMILLLPAIAVYVWLVDRRVYADRRLLGRLFALALVGPALYLYVFWRLLPQGYSAYDILWGTILGGSFIGSLGQSPDWQNILWNLPLQQFGLGGLTLAALGFVFFLAGRPAARRNALLLLLTYAGVSAFCLIYRIPEIEPFLIPAFLCLAVGVSGLAFLFQRFPLPARLGAETLLALSPLLLLGNLTLIPAYWASEDGSTERQARAILAYPLEPDATLEADWNTGTAIRYLQAAESLRPDLQVILVRLAQQGEYERLSNLLRRGRPVYLLKEVTLSRLAAPIQWESPFPNLNRLSPASFTPSEHRLDADLSLQGYRRDGDALILYWQAQDKLTEDYGVATDYFDAAGRLIGQGRKEPRQESLYGFPTSRWTPGQTVSDLFRPLPPDTAYVRAALCTTTGGQRGCLGQGVIFQVRSADPSAIQYPLRVVLGEEIALLGYDLAGTASVSMPITLTLYWQPLRPPMHDYTTFVHLVDAAGQMVGQKDSPPLDNLYPTSAWRPGELIRDTFVVAAQRPPTQIRLGLYDRATMQRLPRQDGGDTIVIPLNGYSP